MKVIKYECNGVGIKTECPHKLYYNGGVIRVSSQCCQNCKGFVTADSKLQEVCCQYEDLIRKDFRLSKISVSDIMRDIKELKLSQNMVKNIFSKMEKDILKLEVSIVSLIEGDSGG